MRYEVLIARTNTSAITSVSVIVGVRLNCDSMPISLSPETQYHNNISTMDYYMRDKPESKRQ